MTLPRIIIPCRASLKAVPPSIREGALAVGASKFQSVFHHVVPLALPGTLSGTIIGLAQALGETAPLILIGMVAFVVDIPASPVDPSASLPELDRHNLSDDRRLPSGEDDPRALFGLTSVGPASTAMCRIAEYCRSGWNSLEPLPNL